MGFCDHHAIASEKYVIGDTEKNESIMLKELAIQFTDLTLEFMQSLASTWCGTIEATYLRASAFKLRTEIAFLFEAMEDRIKGAGAHFISVALQFLDDA
jgi:hypothetical protein